MKRGDIADETIMASGADLYLYIPGINQPGWCFPLRLTAVSQSMSLHSQLDSSFLNPWWVQDKLWSACWILT